MERREGNGTQRKTARTTGSGVDAATQWTRCGVVLRGVALRRVARRPVAFVASRGVNAALEDGC